VNTAEDVNVTYVTRTDFLTQYGRAHEFEGLWREAQALLKRAQGFQGEVLLNSLGYPEKYVTIDSWQTRENLAALYRSAAFHKAVGSAGGGYRTDRAVEAYEVLVTVGQPPVDPGGWSQLVEWEIKSGAATAFEESRKVLFDLRQRHGGVYMSQLFRFLGNSTRYLVMQTYKDQEAEKAGRGISEIKEFFAAHPATRYVEHWPHGEYYTAIQLGQHGT
jgi:heme-degrading monooxygenase HmoA